MMLVKSKVGVSKGTGRQAGCEYGPGGNGVLYHFVTKTVWEFIRSAHILYVSDNYF